MVHFLIHRPIAVIMCYLALAILGVVAYFQLPVSLMPDIAIPEITVKISYPNTSASQLENIVVRNIRQKLQQVTKLEDIHSETRNGSAIIRLRFVYGINSDLAFIETNEKIDASMNNLPRDMQRPMVVKASATDIPVLYLNVSLKEHSDEKFIELSEFCDNVIKRHIEQIPQIAMTDITGLIKQQVVVKPDFGKMESIGLEISDISNAIKQNNLNAGNILIQDGHYQYFLQFNTDLNTKTDVENIFINSENRIIQLKDIATIEIVPQKTTGMFTTQNKPAISMAVIKQSDARMDDMKAALQQTITYFENQYPQLNFEVSRNQTQLLDYSISNLVQSLILGVLLVFLITFIFMHSLKTSFIVGITIPVALIISFLFFHIFNLSVNIVSLSGLILAVGMMIDNSIIVIDNINQHLRRKQNLADACIDGTNEVIRPMLSSVLTTSSIFLPLIFLSGISGALFYDQALTVTIGLFVSFIISITLLPVLYFHLFQSKTDKILYETNKKLHTKNIYEQGFDFVFRRKMLSVISFLLFIPLAVVFYFSIDIEKLPEMKKTDAILQINWNENIAISESRKRLEKLFESVDSLCKQKNSYIGEKQFILESNQNQSMQEATVYFKATSPQTFPQIKEYLKNKIGEQYPETKAEISDAETVFEKIFSGNETPFVVEIVPKNKQNNTSPDSIAQMIKSISNIINAGSTNTVLLDKNLVIEIDFERLLLYQVSYNTLIATLETAFSDYHTTDIKSTKELIPIVLGSSPKLFNEVYATLSVKNIHNNPIPLSVITKCYQNSAFNTITADVGGIYHQMHFDIDDNQTKRAIQKINNMAASYNNYDINFSGSYFSDIALIKELLIVLSVSLLLLYFILAAQFESLLQPLIVLLEIPIDIAGAFFMLWIFGATINIMSMIGIVVMSGIIINDSILKIDTINKLRTKMPLHTAIKTGAHRRLRPIVMTSLTTILALAPFLFFSGIGAELQLPLALTVIGGMTLGTFVSLFLIPLFFWLLNQ